MEEFGDVEDPESAPRSISPFPEDLESTSIPSPEDALKLYELAGAADALEGLQQLTGFDARRAGDSRRDARSAMPFTGGESAGQGRLQEILHGKHDSNSSALPGSSSPAEASEQRSDHAQTSEHGTVSSEQGQSSQLESSRAHAQQGGDTPADGGAESAAASEQPSSAQGGAAGRHDDVEALIHSFKDMRMMASGVNNSAKLSAYLAAGCLSPRQVYWQARNAAEQHGEDTGHSTLLTHLVIRYAGLPDLMPSSGWHLPVLVSLNMLSDALQGKCPKCPVPGDERQACMPFIALITCDYAVLSTCMRPESST